MQTAYAADGPHSSTRIEVAGVIDRLAAGEPLDDVISGYRGRVAHEAVMEARRHA